MLLGSDNTRDPRRAARLLNLALTRWQDLPRERRLRSGDLASEPQGRTRAEAYFPEGGLVLRQYSRDLGDKRRVMGDLTTAYNSDMVWFTRSEARRLLPEKLDKGGIHEVPAFLTRRLARLHLVDSVLGQPAAWAEQQVEKASLTAEIEDISEGLVKLRFRGSSRAAEAKRGIELQMLGRAAFDQRTSRFTSFDLVATGTRWGLNRYRQHGAHAGPGRIGIAFILAGDSAADRVAPHFFWAYGWGR